MGTVDVTVTADGKSGARVRQLLVSVAVMQQVFHRRAAVECLAVTRALDPPCGGWVLGRLLR